MRLVDRIPRHPAFPVLCGLLIALPTLGAGLFMDDVLARVKLLGLDTPWSPAPWWDLYTFARADLNPELLAAGHHPWWADPALRMTFFRPLSAATHALDYALWPHHPALHHLHSVMWYGLTIAVTLALLRRVHPDHPRLVAVAGLAFAVAAPHVMTVGWLAGRNTLIGFAFGALAVLAHLSWRRTRRPAALAAALGLLAVGLLASEAALGSLGYVAAWALCVEPGPWRRRLATLAPYALVVALWRVAYVRAGFGATATAIYHDPGTDLPGFVGAVLGHLPVLILGRWIPLPLDAWALVPPAAHALLIAAAALAVAGLFALLWPLLAARPRARFWAAGVVLSLVPFTATMPMDRLVFFAGPGAAGLVGLLAAAPDGPGPRTRRALLVLCLPVAAVVGLLRGITLPLYVGANTAGAEQAPRDAAVPGQTFVHVTGTFHRTHYATLMRQAAGDPAVPRRSVILSSMLTGATVHRPDARTLEISPDGGYMARMLDQIHRRLDAAFAVGDTVTLPDLDVEIRALTPDGRPARAAFRFRRPLEDPSLRWLMLTPAGPLGIATRPFPLPAVGETVRVPAAL